MSALKVPNKVLVIKLRHLGDVLLASPVFSNLKKAYPDAQIDAYIWEESLPMLEGHPAIDRFHVHDRRWKKLSFFKRLPKELGLLRQIRSEKYDLVINLTEGDRGLIAARVSGAGVRVGVDPRNRMRKWLTHLVKSCPNPRHTVERDLDALRKLGIFPSWHDRELFFAVPSEAKEKVRAMVGSEPFVLIHPVSRWRFKCPPPHLMAKVIDNLHLPVVLSGGPSEIDFVDEVVSCTKTKVLNVAGKLNLKELGALIDLCTGMISVDSVPLHMASALKAPVLAIFGPTSEENWGPWQHPKAKVMARNLACRPCRLDGCGGSKMSDCLWTLSPEAIAQEFHALIGSAEDSTSAASLLVLNSWET